MFQIMKNRGCSSEVERQLPKLTFMAYFLSKSTDKLGEIGSGSTYFPQSHFSIFLKPTGHFARIMFFRKGRK